MALDPERLRIVTYPAPVLKKRARPIGAITAEVRSVAARMLRLMHEAPGVGLAAPQVGLDWRLFVANPSGQPEDDRVFINPVLTRPGRDWAEQEEGCLSIPGVRVVVRRPQTITVTATDLDGRPFELTSSDLPARVWQHETDHLDGVLILDRMNELDRLANRRVIKELEASGKGR